MSVSQPVGCLSLVHVGMYDVGRVLRTVLTPVQVHARDSMCPDVSRVRCMFGLSCVLFWLTCDDWQCRIKCDARAGPCSRGEVLAGVRLLNMAVSRGQNTLRRDPVKIHSIALTWVTHCHTVTLT